MRIVFDTNVLISATITKGRSFGLLTHCLENHDLVTSQSIIGEYTDRLLNKFKFSVEKVTKASRETFLLFEIVSPDPLPTRVCPDPDDDMIIATAIAGDCEFIITGDKALAGIGAYNTIKIITPSDFSRIEPYEQ